MTLSAQQVATIVQNALASFKHAPFSRQSAIGAPWPEDRVKEYVARLEEALVTPYSQRIAIKDSHEQMTKSPQDEAEYWVVAETRDYLEFYDPLRNEFGLADRGAGTSLPSTVGVRGDLVGVFCAM